jgi:sn-glycerol 3-phosphate transport system ATP-binding protein
MAQVTLRRVAKSFDRHVQAVKGINLDIADEEFVVLVGPSGCGKSTTLRLIAGLEELTDGEIAIGGEVVNDIPPRDRDIAMVFQNYALYPHMSVFENMAYGLRIRRLPRAEIQRRVDQTAAMLGIEALLERRPRALSGGQRQRVAMGRAIVREPKLFLFDEPLSNLDAKLRVQMRAEIRRLQRRLGVTSLYVTHDQVEAMTLGDRLVVMHDGRPVQTATPMEVFSRPADTYVAGFIGAPAMNFLPARLAKGGRAAKLGAGPMLLFADGPRAGPEGRSLTIGIRPEHVVSDRHGMPLAVELAEPLGSETLLHGRLTDGTGLVVKVMGAAPAAETLAVALPAAFLHVFDAASGDRLDPLPAAAVEPLAGVPTTG